MKFATFLYQTNGPEIVALAQRAEALGYESLWIPDHIVLPVHYESCYPYDPSGRMSMPPETPFLDPMIALGFAAAATKTIRLATGILVVPIRNPFATAKAVATLDVLSGGRAIFGVGIGWLKEEFQALGMNFEDRARRTREYIALMKELWTSDDPVFNGTTVKAAGIRCMPHPIQKPHPPIIFGGDTDPSLRRAAQLGDGWYGIVNSINAAREFIGRLRAFERECGRARPLELTINPRLERPLSLEHVAQFAEMGVDRLLLSGARSAPDAIATIERLHDTLMT
jgi:probable F420-dependent oxidoreductase